MDYSKELTEKILLRMDEIKNSVFSGHISTLEKFKQHEGHISGLKEATHIVREFYAKLNEEEE